MTMTTEAHGRLFTCNGRGKKTLQERNDFSFQMSMRNCFSFNTAVLRLLRCQAVKVSSQEARIVLVLSNISSSCYR